MLVEDSEDIRELMREFLETEGFDVVEASNGLEALQLLAMPTTEVDLVLLDLAMPIMDGVQFIREVDGDPRYARLPIIVLSATPKPVQLERAALFLKKPIDLDALLVHARSYTRGSMAQRV